MAQALPLPQSQLVSEWLSQYKRLDATSSAQLHSYAISVSNHPELVTALFALLEDGPHTEEVSPGPVCPFHPFRPVLRHFPFSAATATLPPPPPPSLLPSHRLKHLAFTD